MIEHVLAIFGGLVVFALLAGGAALAFLSTLKPGDVP